MVRKAMGRDGTYYAVDRRSHELIEVISSTSSELKIRSSDSSFEVESTGKIVYLPVDERPRVVRFSLDHAYFSVMNRRDIPKDVKSDIWYRSSEIKEMRASTNGLDGKVLEDSESEADMVRKDGYFTCQRALHKLMAVSCVLDEQDRQRRENKFDPILLSQKYREFVLRSRGSLFISQLARHERIPAIKRSPNRETLLRSLS